MPDIPASAAVLGDLDFWREGLGEVGVDVSEAGPVDLAVAPARLASAAAELTPRMLVVHGDARRVLEAEGYACRTYLPIPSATAPRAWLPLDSPAVCAYALHGWTISSSGWKGMRNQLLRRLIARHRAPVKSSWVTVGGREDPVPWVAREAAARLRAEQPAWFLTIGPGDSLDYRGVLHLFSGTAREPQWVVKFARRAGATKAFERDRAGLALAVDAGPVATGHAPALIDTFEHAGIPASIESAAVGAALSAVLRSRTARRAKLEIVERVAGWIVELGAKTAGAGELAAELDRLANRVLPEWAPYGVDVDLVRMLHPVPAVFQHNDLWSENVIVHRDTFTIVDWEDARPHGLPLWDLVYFLADALALIDGAFEGAARHAHFVALFKGELPSSAMLFEWVRSAVEACSIPPDSVGPIVTTCWLSQVLSHITRGEDAARFEIHGLSELPSGEQWATLWLGDPALGPGWSAWRR